MSNISINLLNQIPISKLPFFYIAKGVYGLALTIEHVIFELSLFEVIVTDISSIAIKLLLAIPNIVDEFTFVENVRFRWVSVVIYSIYPSKLTLLFKILTKLNLYEFLNGCYSKILTKFQFLFFD